MPDRTKPTLNWFQNYIGASVSVRVWAGRVCVYVCIIWHIILLLIVRAGQGTFPPLRPQMAPNPCNLCVCAWWEASWNCESRRQGKHLSWANASCGNLDTYLYVQWVRVPCLYSFHRVLLSQRTAFIGKIDCRTGPRLRFPRMTWKVYSLLGWIRLIAIQVWNIKK